MKRFWFRLLWVVFFLIVLAVVSTLEHESSVYAQTIPTATAVDDSHPYITNTYTTEPFVNVRAGPSSVYYGGPIGQLPIGATAQALAVTAGHDWIEISFASGPDGVGWVYAPFVTLTGNPPIIEPPPTMTPVAISTLDPAMAATFRVKPTETRLPTFTPPAPLAHPTFSNPETPSSGQFPFGTVIVSLLVVGIFGAMVSFIGRR